MISTSEDYATVVEERDGIPAPSLQNQELILDAWREVLAHVLHTRDTEWKEQLRVIKAESMAAVAELRAAAAEFRSTMEVTIVERLAQIRPIDGKEGPRGERGEKGEPGELPIVRAWMEDEISYAGDIVSCDGGTWQARKDTSKRPPHADWKPLALPGRDATSPTIRGTYGEDETYRHLDIVALNGSSFVARHDQPGPCPGEGWQLIASAGRVGKPGIRGEKGDKGERGEVGPRIVGCEINRASYALTRSLAGVSQAPLPLFWGVSKTA
jgi:hypothetical protein